MRRCILAAFQRINEGGFNSPVSAILILVRLLSAMAGDSHQLPGRSAVWRAKMSKSTSMAFVAGFILVSFSPVFAESASRITILYDAFGKPSEMQKDWGVRGTGRT